MDVGNGKVVVNMLFDRGFERLHAFTLGPGWFLLLFKANYNYINAFNLLCFLPCRPSSFHKHYSKKINQ